MLRILTGILFVFLLAACNTSARPDTETVEDESLEEIAEINLATLDTITVNGEVMLFEVLSAGELAHVQTIEEYSDRAIIIDDSLHVFPQNSGIDFVLNNGDTFRLKNIGNTVEIDDSYTEYYYIRDYKGSDYWVIAANYYEGRGNFLVDKRNGELIETIGEAKLSPNGNFFASGNADIVAGYDLNGLAVYELTEDGLATIFYFDDINWGADKVQWKDNHTLYLQQNYWASDSVGQRMVKLNLQPLGIE